MNIFFCKKEANLENSHEVADSHVASDVVALLAFRGEEASIEVRRVGGQERLETAGFRDRESE